MELYHIRRRSAWATQDELDAASAVSTRVCEEMPDRLRWIRSYVLLEKDGRLGSVCIFQASDPDAVIEHGKRIAAPADEFHVISGMAVINEDPQLELA